MKCWGATEMNSKTSNDILSYPAVTAGLASGVSSVASGYGFTGVLMSDGHVKTWGTNDHGQLGNGTSTDSHAIVDVIGL